MLISCTSANFRLADTCYTARNSSVYFFLIIIFGDIIIFIFVNINENNRMIQVIETSKWNVETFIINQSKLFKALFKA